MKHLNNENAVIIPFADLINSIRSTGAEDVRTAFDRADYPGYIFYFGIKKADSEEEDEE